MGVGGQKTIVRGKTVKPVTFVPGFFVGGQEGHWYYYKGQYNLEEYCISWPMKW